MKRPDCGWCGERIVGEPHAVDCRTEEPICRKCAAGGREVAEAERRIREARRARRRERRCARCGGSVGFFADAGEPTEAAVVCGPCARRLVREREARPDPMFSCRRCGVLVLLGHAWSGDPPGTLCRECGVAIADEIALEREQAAPEGPATRPPAPPPARPARACDRCGTDLDEGMPGFGAPEPGSYCARCAIVVAVEAGERTGACRGVRCERCGTMVSVTGPGALRTMTICDECAEPYEHLAEAERKHLTALVCEECGEPLDIEHQDESLHGLLLCARCAPVAEGGGD